MMIMNNLPKSLIGLFLALSTLIACSDQERSRGQSGSAISITKAQTEQKDLSDTFSVASEVTAYKRVYVASRMSGLIEEVHYEEGDRVAAGDLMAKLDVRQEEVDLRRASSVVEEAEDQYQRTEALYSREAVSEAEYLSAKRALDQAKADVDRLKLRIDFGSIRSPISGVVTARLVEIGNNVSVNERMFTVTDMDLLVVRPGVSELNLRGIEEGQELSIELDVYPGREFPAQVRRIFPNADPISRLFTVEVELLQSENSPIIRPGYLARVQFSADERSMVVAVPSETILRKNGESYIFILNDLEDEVTMTEVEIGIQRDGYTEILQGVEEGVQIAAGNLESLSDGASVRVVGEFRRAGFRN